MARQKDPVLEKRRKESVMDTVVEMLSEGPATQLSLDRVAKRAGVSKGMVTYYFQSKDVLLIESIRQYHRQQEEMLNEIISLDVPAEQKLKLLIHAAFSSEALIKRELRFQVEVWSYAKQFPEVMDEVSASYRAFRQTCEGLLKRGIDEGYVNVSETEWTYRMIHALVDGLSFQVAADPALNIDDLLPRLMALIETLLGVDRVAASTC